LRLVIVRARRAPRQGLLVDPRSPEIGYVYRLQRESWKGRGGGVRPNKRN
jgi:hypothetical protein